MRDEDEETETAQGHREEYPDAHSEDPSAQARRELSKAQSSDRRVWFVGTRQFPLSGVGSAAADRRTRPPPSTRGLPTPGLATGDDLS